MKRLLNYVLIGLVVVGLGAVISIARQTGWIQLRDRNASLTTFSFQGLGNDTSGWIGPILKSYTNLQFFTSIPRSDPAQDSLDYRLVFQVAHVDTTKELSIDSTVTISNPDGELSGVIAMQHGQFIRVIIDGLAGNGDSIPTTGTVWINLSDE